MNMILSHTEKTKRQDAAFREAIYKMDQDTALAAAIRLGYDIDRLAEVVGMHRPDGSSRKMDAGESALLARALIYMKAKSVDVQYAPTRFREVFANNLNTEVPLGADKVSTPQFDQLGAFAPISNGVNDLPNIDVSQSETLNKVFPYGAQISYTVFDLARAAFSGVPLDTKKQEAARKACIKGITNHGSIQTVTTDSAGLWSAKTGLQIHADVAKLYTSIVSTTKGTVAPAVLALDTAHFALVSVKSWSADNSANITVLDFITKSLPGVRVVQWARLDLADAGGDGPRIVMFGDASDVCEFIINDMTMLAPQISGLGVNVPMYGRTAGVVASQPKGIAIMDDV
jgi:hypothetical protein